MARKAAARVRTPARTTFVDRHNLWSAAQHRAASSVERAIKHEKLETVRFSFCDQHGVLRGKTLLAADAVKALRAGVTMTTTLLAKDAAHKTAFPVFTEGGGFGLPQMQGAGDFMMVADPTKFRVLPWTERTGWLLCDIVFSDGAPLPYSTRNVLRDALARLDAAGFGMIAGLEVEFGLYRLEDPMLAPEVCAWPPPAPRVSLTTQGFQYLTEGRFDQAMPTIDVLRRTVSALGLPLRSVELELGPSQYEFTFAPQAAMDAADSMVLFRSAMKQTARRHGHLLSFMTKPNLPGAMANGWHLHASLTQGATNAFMAKDALLSDTGRHFLAGLLAHANAITAFATPTLNGYRRYRPYAMAPAAVTWARDNRGVMVRVMGAPGDPATHLENRIGEPLANPYLYMAAQIHAGLDGLANKREPPPSADLPYAVDAPALPASLGEALDALDGSACFRAGFGDAFIDYYVTLKRAEILRAQAEAGNDANDEARHTWEHREYFDMG